MGFFARPDLSDVQFKQELDSILTLSGQTRIASWSGLTLSDGAGGNIIVTASGATSASTGQVLTYRNGKISLEPTGASGDSRYYGASPTTVTVGGLSCNSFISGCTIQCILQNILVPPIPISTSLSIINSYSGGSISAICRQFGDCSFGCMCWCVCKNTYPICAISLSTDGSTSIGSAVYDCILLSGSCINATTGGTLGYTFTEYTFADPSCSGLNLTGSSACTSITAYYVLSAASTTNEISNTSASIIWQNKAYCFGSNVAYYSTNLPNSSILISGSQSFITSKTLNTTYTLNNQFFYYAYPKILGTPTFTINGLPNNAWGNLGTGTLFTMTFINANGYSNQYYVARSDSRITGNYCIIAC
jgi:hypothetical protein